MVNTPGAWQHLKDCDLNPFGAPEIIIAFVDQGIQSSGGVPAQPEFQAAVSDGSSKVYLLYDFNNLVPNNDALLGDHGSLATSLKAEFPIPPFPNQPPLFPHRFCNSRKELGVIVRNLGPGDAPASKLRVDFLACNKTTMLDIPPIAAAQVSAIIVVRTLSCPSRRTG